ncbi:uncharacterized protein isoform X2 [Rhodnius prolixus]|uniref:uncharacterized protein isoform X1 n=1 Tax=Rhodnius prolixus TaxID=13249 RepID=UPI003D18A9D3
MRRKILDNHRKNSKSTTTVRYRRQRRIHKRSFNFTKRLKTIVTEIVETLLDFYFEGLLPISLEELEKDILERRSDIELTSLLGTKRITSDEFYRAVAVGTVFGMIKGRNINNVLKLDLDNYVKLYLAYMRPVTIAELIEDYFPPFRRMKNYCKDSRKKRKNCN